MITDKQKNLIALIEAFISDNGYSPTIKELSDLEGVGLNATHGRLKQLKDKGVVEWVGNTARTIRLTGLAHVKKDS